MSPKSYFVPLLTSAFVLSLNSCDPKHGESRSEQLEETAETLEAKAKDIRLQTEESAELKKLEAEQIRKKNGNSESVEVLEKDASVTREVGERKADQLEEQAKKVREKKEKQEEVEKRLQKDGAQSNKEKGEKPK